METAITTDVRADDDGTHKIVCELTLKPSIDEWNETTVEVEKPLRDVLQTGTLNDEDVDLYATGETEKGIVVSIDDLTFGIELVDEQTDTVANSDTDADAGADADAEDTNNGDEPASLQLSDAEPLEASTSATATTTATTTTTTTTDSKRQEQNQTAPVGPIAKEFDDSEMGWQDYAEKRLQEAAEKDGIPDEVGENADGTVIDDTDESFKEWVQE